MMNKSRIILPVMLLFWIVASAGIAQIKWSGDYQTALQKAQAQGKSIFLYCYTPESKECQQVEASFFTNVQVSGFINAHLVPVRINVNA
ncbi:thioredoxin family protein, partial [Candidatus Sumerlaeota bacterium]|nr:thioredoxin family protein [Candidatus Sumerlaeota bacterium]